MLAVLDGQTNAVRCIALDEADGLSASETNGQISYPPGICLRDGRIAFAKVRGVAPVQTSDRIDPQQGPPTHLKVLRAGGTPFFEQNPGNVPPASPHETPLLCASPPSQHWAAEIGFTACSFQGFDRTRLRYPLLGLTSQWTDAGGLNKANFVGLRPGAYVFEVEAANKYGRWSASPAWLAFRIEPHYHERIGVRLAGFLLVIGMIYRALIWRLKELRRLHELEAEAARAQEVWTRFCAESERLVIRIEDNGCGFNVESTPRKPRRVSTGLGLSSLTHRLHTIRGSAEIRSRPGRETCVELRIPL